MVLSCWLTIKLPYMICKARKCPSRLNKQWRYLLNSYVWMKFDIYNPSQSPRYHFQNRYLNFFKGRIDLPPQLICYGLTDESSVYYWLNFFVFILFWWNVVKLYYTFAVLHFHEVSSCFEKQKSFFNSLSTYFR